MIFIYLQSLELYLFKDHNDYRNGNSSTIHEYEKLYSF